MKKFLNVIFSICFSIFIITTAINFTVSFKQLYYYDIDKLNIPKLSHLSKEEIKLNYDYLVKYNLSKNVKEFKMPTIKSSEQGKIHFEEVRDIFQNINKISKICLFISLIGIAISIRNKDIQILNYTSKALITIPIILAIPIIINFEDTFVVFHKLMFSNDYWIFDPRLDPVINILPEEFFFHAGIMILGIVLAVSIILYTIYKFISKKIEQ